MAAKGDRTFEITVCSKIFTERYPASITKPSEKKAYEAYIREKRKLESDPHYVFRDRDGKEHRLPLSRSVLYSRTLGLDKEVKEDISKRNLEASALKSSLEMMKASLLKASPSKSIERKEVRKEKDVVEERKEEILSLLGRGFSSAEVNKMLLERGIDVGFAAIRKIHEENRPYVNQMRDGYNNGLKDVSLYSKRSRLERLSYLMNELIEDFEKERQGKERRRISTEMRGVLEQARKEAEGDSLKLTVDGRIDVTATLAANQGSIGIGQGLTLAQLVISRVASRLHLRSQYFIDHLAHSYYARWNGFSSNEDLKTKPIYPTSTVYDILDAGMEAKNRDWERGQAVYNVVDEQDGEGGSGERKEEIRKRLLALLQKGR